MVFSSSREALARIMPANISVPHHGIAGIDFHVAAASDNDDATSQGKESKVFAEVHIGEHFEDTIDSAALCRPEDGLAVIRVVVVENLVATQIAHELASFARAGGSKDANSCAARKLHRRRADSPARAMHEHRFAGACLSTMK